jgi:predicted DNA binding CopG/RHH family protein
MRKEALKKIPKFKSNEEAGKFWIEHDTADYFDLSKAERAYPRAASAQQPKDENVVDIPLPEQLVKRVKARAKQEAVPITALMKRYVEEGLARDRITQ